jgi:hypothetical protein
MISDGAHGTTGNPDFFFLPPMVPNPRRNPNWNVGAFNPNLSPVIDICEVEATTEAGVNGAPCKVGGYFLSYQLGPVRSHDDEDGDDDGDDFHYWHSLWRVPESPVVFYRVTVRVGAKKLGFADIETANSLSQLRNVNTGEFVPLKDGRRLPIKFRIEQYALCAVPGVGPCSSASVVLATGGTVAVTLPGSNGPTGVAIPPEPASTTTTNITVQSCPDLNSRETDLPTFGSCVRVTADPPLPPSGLTIPASVFVCDLHVVLGTDVLDDDQSDRITLHRLDAGPVMTALPHAPGCPVQTVDAGWSVKGILKDLVAAKWKSAGDQLATMLGPKPAYAMFLHVGGGGTTKGFSDFQFALPCKLGKAAGDNQTAQPGTTLPVDPTVLVSDLGGAPCRRARVTFATAAGSVAPPSFVTGPDGLAHAAWTLPSTSGLKTMTASGRGLAGDDFNGPRTGVDPFQPIQTPFDLTDVLAEVPVVTGSVTFNATGQFLPVDIFGFGSGGYTYLAGTIGEGGTPRPTPAPGWQNVVFTPTGWTTGGTAAFGGSYGGCAINSSFASPFLVNTDLFVRKVFDTPYAGTLTLAVRIDNDAQVWLDGVNITSTGSSTNPETSKLLEGWWIHDYCADDAAPTFTKTGVAAGSHTLAIWAHDRGAVGYLDVKVSLAP